MTVILSGAKDLLSDCAMSVKEILRFAQDDRDTRNEQ
uniref:Uncharacterized protein n=1 Tax=uncultured bacterium 16 TaxID=1748268 RepID=A0A0U3TRM0_9BACT|nr:hypothetical protein [uncultured bacterium 16]